MCIIYKPYSVYPEIQAVFNIGIVINLIVHLNFLKDPIIKNAEKNIWTK